MGSEPLVLGVDVGGTKVAVGAVSGREASEIVEHPTDTSGSEPLLDGIEAGVREVIAKVGEPAAIGVGVPSQIEFATGTVLTSVNIPLAGVPLREVLGHRLGLPVYVDNDANCAGLAEAELLEIRNLVMLTLGTGVGGGVVNDGRIFRGAHGLGAELGHFSIIADGPPCPGNCPNRGCLEALCSGTALERDASELGKARPDTRLGRIYRENGRVSGRDAVAAAQDGDPEAKLLFERLGTWLGIGIAGYVNVFEPEHVLIGGGLSRASGLFLERAVEETASRALPALWERVTVQLARGGADAGVIGAGLLAAHETERDTAQATASIAARIGERERDRQMTTTEADTRALDELCINTIRTLSMDGVQNANSGHPGAPMALAPVAYVLYTRVMKHNPADPDWFDRDRFVLSAGHASMLLYSSLYLAGYGLSLDDLKSFRQLGSPTAGHPEYHDAAGIEATTGPLGQGLSMAVGMALAEAMLADRFNRPGKELIDHHTYAIASDGDVQEGVASEACSLAGHLGLGKLILFYDNNHIQLAGPTSMGFSEDVGKRFEAYGWHVHDQGEDLELDSLESAVAAAKAVPDRPSLVMLRTHIGFGAPNLQDTNKAHGSPLGEEEVKLTKEAYNWPVEPTFLVPDEALKHFRDAAAQRGETEAEWKQLAESYRSENPELWEELSLVIEGRLPEGWDGEVPKFRPEDGRIATRKASHQVIQWAAERVPNLISGSADLEPSTLTLIEDGGSVERGKYAGRNVHYGVREHGMGAIVNGLNLHGLRAFGSTFFNFLDYMKGAVRLAALMELPSIFVFTHDSIGLGEDGPTHQPVEQLATLRAQPNTYAVRPSGANETALAWRFAIEQTDTPVALVLSRQGLPVWNPSGVPDDAIHRGAYVLRHSYKDEPDLILIGTGSETHICTQAADRLEADGIATRVVSAPCLDRFAEQDEDYRNEILPPGVRARVSVEAASTLGWATWVTDDGESIGMETFGASGPQVDLYEHFGFTAEKVAQRGKAVVERVAARA